MPSSPETAHLGKVVAARVGTNIREVRTELGMTQAQLAAPDFSISYILYQPLKEEKFGLPSKPSRFSPNVLMFP